MRLFYCQFDGSADVELNVQNVTAILADSASSAGTADKLSTARKISFTGAAIGEGIFDGGNDITINLTVPEESSMIGEISTAEIDAMF